MSPTDTSPTTQLAPGATDAATAKHEKSSRWLPDNSRIPRPPMAPPQRCRVMRDDRLESQRRRAIRDRNTDKLTVSDPNCVRYNLPMVEVPLKVASFFSGIGGFDLGLERAGMQVVFQCEIDRFGQAVLRKHWPSIPLAEDIRLVNPTDIPKGANVWCAGFPCQDVSLANQGKRKGLDGERSGLFYEVARLAEKRKPRWLILENVPGLLNSHNGEDFRGVLATLDELGYGVSWRVLDAKYFGTPQRRRRVYIIASRGSLRAARVLFDEGTNHLVARAGLGKKDLIARSAPTGVGSSEFYAIQHATVGRKASAGPQAKGFRNDGETYTLDSRGSGDIVCATTSPFRMRNTAGLSKKLDSNRYRALGNAVNVEVIAWIGSRIVNLESQVNKDSPSKSE